MMSYFSALQPAPPKVRGKDRSRRIRIRVAAIVSVAIVLASCSTVNTSSSRSNHPAPRTTQAPPAEGPHGLMAADPRLTDRLELGSTRVQAGRSIDGTLVVSSRAHAPINLTQECKPSFGVALENAAIHQGLAFTASCTSEPFLIIPGINRLPVTVITTYLGCIEAGGSSFTEPGDSSTTPFPRCTSGGATPPLPPGRYSAVLSGSGELALPQPKPIVVTLSPPWVDPAGSLPHR
jgi:hypothetical protein